jgi:hypothetical protein
LIQIRIESFNNRASRRALLRTCAERLPQLAPSP